MARKLILEDVLAMAAQGKTTKEIANITKTKVFSVQRFCRENEIVGPNIHYGAGRNQFDSRMNNVGKVGASCSSPPSLAMIRLAQFDPVVARALAVRMEQLHEA